jgi:murein DD-endopeptidase MepM/ murein hydrolase activator NlpD
MMCAMACLIVLVLADYRVSDEGLGAAMRPPEPADALAFSSSASRSQSAKVKKNAIRASKSPQPASLRLDLPIDPSELLVSRRDSSGWAVMHAAAPLEQRVRTAAGEIVTTFAHAAADAGVPEVVVSQLADVLGWEFDFTKDLEPGARFRIAYEEEIRHGVRVNGRLLAAELQSGGKWYDAYYFEPERGAAGYFDANGRALGRDFLRYPVAYTRISSGFGRRFHPVLRVHRPHYGVDFAAPVGTPVRAVASGIVAKSGWYGASGRFVKLRHGGGHETGYAHLSRIAPDIRPGTVVSKGETIGYVGRTGQATGPHLLVAL